MAIYPASDTTLDGYDRVSGPPGMLAANADRERTLDVLKASFAEGRLTKAECDDRTDRVYSARTYGELGALIADLPTGPLGGPAHFPSIGYPSRPAVNSMALARLLLCWAGIGLITAIITGLIITTSVSGHSVNPVVAHPVSGGPGGPVQGG